MSSPLRNCFSSYCMYPCSICIYFMHMFTHFSQKICVTFWHFYKKWLSFCPFFKKLVFVLYATRLHFQFIIINFSTHSLSLEMYPVFWIFWCCFSTFATFLKISPNFVHCTVFCLFSRFHIYLCATFDVCIGRIYICCYMLTIFSFVAIITHFSH